MMLSIFLGVCDSNLKSVAFFVTQAIPILDLFFRGFFEKSGFI